MNRHESLLKLFGEVLATVTSPTPLASAPTPWRAELERQLSLAIVDEEYRGVYQHVLLKFGNNHHRTMPPSIPIDQIPTNLILKSGLGVLDDESLAKLSLDLFAIEPLANRYENATEPGSLGEIWAEVFTWSTPEELAEESAQTLNVYNKIKQILSEEDEVKD